MTIQRRLLTQAQWLDALGIDSFWITDGSPGVLAAAPDAFPTVSSPAHTAGGPDWPTLDARIRSCQACGLCRKRTQAIPGTGDPKASWMLVGEAPGADEDALGEPFAGQAVQLLDAMIAALGLERARGVYLTNAVKCRPPENHTPDASEIAACHAFLDQQIGLLAPRVILALGPTAAHAVLGQAASIQALRGRIHYRKLNGRQIPVVVTHHPADLLRQPTEKSGVWEDLLLAESAVGA
jgi:DNA polymerase